MREHGTKQFLSWSPCSKLIAASTSESIEVLDAVTLNRLATFKDHIYSHHFSFSPDSRSLTLFTRSKLISWDIQTGGRLCEILPKPGKHFLDVASSTYSKDGKTVASCGKFYTLSGTEYIIYTFDLLSRTCLGHLPVPDGEFVTPIWTHDACLRFATINRGSITIWEVGFTLKLQPTKVESFLIPDEVVDGREFLFLPILYRLAFTLRDTIHIRDVKASTLLLKSEQASNSYPLCSFSSDGRFFAFAITSGEVRIWKESPTGYALHQQPPFLLDILKRPFLSPNGRSIILPLVDIINLWHIDDQTLSPPSPPTEERGPKDDFLLAFSPCEKSAAFVQLHGNMVTILDLRSGDLRLTIDTGMRVECLGVAGDTVVVIDKGRIVTWNLPGGDRTFNASINDSVRTVVLAGHSLDSPSPSNASINDSFWPLMLDRFFPDPPSLSPDLSRIVAIEEDELTRRPGPRIYDVPTGKCLAIATTLLHHHPRFTRDGREVWTTYRHPSVPQYEGLEIIEGSLSGAMELKPLEETLYPSRTFLWDSIRGYKVTGDGWVLSPTQKRLLWLPHRWRSDREVCRLWSGKFLGLSHKLSEVVILEFFE